MSVESFIERLENERVGLIQSIDQYSVIVQQWRGDLITLDAVLDVLREADLADPEPDTAPVGEVGAYLPSTPTGAAPAPEPTPVVEEVVEETEVVEVVEEPVDEPVLEQPDDDEPGAVDDAPGPDPAAEVPSEPSPEADADGDEAAPAEPTPEPAQDEVSESADAPAYDETDTVEPAEDQPER